MTLSTHVLDVSSGKPAAGLSVTLFRCNGSAREELAHGTTNANGRIDASFGGDLPRGEYDLVFQAGAYFAATDTRSFYTAIPICFTIEDDAHYHVPLLLSPWAYSTYRGS